MKERSLKLTSIFMLSTVLMAACSQPGLTPSPPGFDATAITMPAGPTTATFEAERAEIEILKGQGVIEAGAPTGGKIIADKAASGGQAVALLGNGSTVQFTVGRDFVGGTYTVNLRGRGIMYAGSPIVSIRINDTEQAQVNLTTVGYTDFALPSLNLKAGDRIGIVFINDAYAGLGKDRNAVVDYITLMPSPPAPAPSPKPAPAPAGNYIQVAKEGASFTVSGTQTVRYGQGSTWIAKSVTGTGQCTNEFFGNDPVPGTGKFCEVLTPPPSFAPAPIPAPLPTPPAPTPMPVSPGAVSVRDFGARGDGVTDDTAALRRAATTRGKDIVFPAGTYLVRGVITFDGSSNQKIIGNNASLKAASSFIRDGRNAVLYIINSTNVTVDGLDVTGHRTASTSPSTDIDGVRVVSSQNVTLRNLSVSKAPTNGITVMNTRNSVIENVAVSESTRHGIWSSKNNNIRLLHNTIIGNGAPNALTYGGIGILATVGDGFYAEGNTIRQTSDGGSKTEAVNNVTYRNNTVSEFGKDGIKVMPLPPVGVTSVSNAVVEGNTISGYQGWCPDGSGSILMQSVNVGSVRGNTITGSNGAGGSKDEDGIRVNTYGSGPRSTGIEVSGNVIRKSVIGLRMNADNLNVTGNWVQAVQYAAVLGGKDINLNNNPELNGGANVTVLYDSGTRANVTGNILSGRDTGIYAANSGNQGSIYGNTFASTYRRTVVAGSGIKVTP